MFVIDKEGVLRYHGAIDDNRTGLKRKEETVNYVEKVVRQIVADEPVDPTYVKPYGCQVKF